MPIVLTHTQLHELLAPVIPLAGDDWGLPVLHSVWLQRNAAHLVAASTNRYVAGFQRVKPFAMTEGQFSCLLPLKVAKQLLKFFPRPGKYVTGTQTVALSIDSDKLTVVSGHDEGIVNPDGPLDMHVTYETLDRSGRFPDVFGLVKSKLAESKDARVDRLGVTLEYLARFQHAQRAKHEPAVLRLGASERSPLIVQVGSDFLGIIMPVQLSTRETGEQTYDQTMTGWTETVSALSAAIKEIK